MIKLITSIVFSCLIVIVNAQTLENDGYIIDKNHRRRACHLSIYPAYEGLLNQYATSVLVQYHDEPPHRLKADDLNGFVIEQDTFMLIENVPVHPKKKPIKYDFAKKVADGEITLLEHLSSSHNGIEGSLQRRYILKRKAQDQYYVIYVPEQQKAHVLSILENCQLVATQLSSITEKDWLCELPQWVKMYNACNGRHTD